MVPGLKLLPMKMVADAVNNITDAVGKINDDVNNIADDVGSTTKFK